METPVKNSFHSPNQDNSGNTTSPCVTLLIQNIQQIIQQLELLENTLAECWAKEGVHQVEPNTEKSKLSDGIKPS